MQANKAALSNKSNESEIMDEEEPMSKSKARSIRRKRAKQKKEMKSDGVSTGKENTLSTSIRELDQTEDGSSQSIANDTDKKKKKKKKKRPKKKKVHAKLDSNNEEAQAKTTTANNTPSSTDEKLFVTAKSEAVVIQSDEPQKEVCIPQNEEAKESGTKKENYPSLSKDNEDVFQSRAVPNAEIVVDPFPMEEIRSESITENVKNETKIIQTVKPAQVEFLRSDVQPPPVQNKVDIYNDDTESNGSKKDDCQCTGCAIS